MNHIIRLVIIIALIIGVGLAVHQPSTAHARPHAGSYTFVSTPYRYLADYSGGPRTTSDTLNVPDAIQIESVAVYIDASHYSVGDLVITLSHGATSVTLMDRPGVPDSSRGCRRNHIDATFDDSHSTEVETMCYTYGGDAIRGDVAPASSLSAFEGQSSEGDWVISFTDHASGDDGNLAEWELQIEGQPIVADVNPTGVISYGCNSGGLSVNFMIENVPAGTYRHVSGAWLVDLYAGGAQDGGHLMWREWTAALDGNPTAVSVPVSEVFDTTTSGLTVYSLHWPSVFGGTTLPTNSHIRVFYQVWSVDFRSLYGSGEVLIPNCAG